MLLNLCLYSFIAVASAAYDKAFIIELSPFSSLSGRSLGPHGEFHKRANALDYSVRHEFNSPDTYLGLSIQVRSEGTNAEIQAQIEAIPGVLAVSPVLEATIPIVFNKTADPLLSFPNASPPKVAAKSGPLSSTLQMGGVDKLHKLGIKGKGIKIGIVDTGVDYRHPSLGGGFGPGFKIAGGWAFVTDSGAAANAPDPLAICSGGGHGTHVAGILGMESVPGQFDITGVAPEASLYMYRAFNCDAQGGTDAILSSMLKAQEHGVDIVSMSLSVGASQSSAGDIDPLAAVTKKLTDAGIAVIVAAANSAGGGKYLSNLYTAKWPSTEPSAIAVGAIANKDFPLVYSAVDSAKASIKYASVFPLDIPDGTEMDIFMVEDGCNSNAWETALATVQNVNKTIFAFPVLINGCTTNYIGNWNGNARVPKYLMAYNSQTDDLYDQCYNVPKQGYFPGSPQFTNVAYADGQKLVANFAAAGGYPSYKLKFPSKNYESIPQPSGGKIDYYSSYGPVWHTYDLKPQVSAPGGHILATWPLGPLSGWVIISGTSMATPYVAGSFALIKTQFPKATINEIKEMIQTTADPLPWINDATVLSTTAQQGAGAINVYKAIFAKSKVSPGQIVVNDNSRTEYGKANITISNPSQSTKTYTLSHQGAGYAALWLNYREVAQTPNYGSAKFTETRITLAPGKSTTVGISIAPPASVNPDALPVFSGFISVSTSDGEKYSVPYLGPPYSIYNTPYIYVSTSGTILPQVYGYDASGSSTRNQGFLEIDPKYGFGSAISIKQYYQEMRLDVLPANTNITANHYGENTTIKAWTAYQPSKVVPTSRLFGFESFGTLTQVKSWSVSSPGPNRRDTLVLGADGVWSPVGPGDYRWYLSVLRVGGTSGFKADYDTWLGPVIRFTGN